MMRKGCFAFCLTGSDLIGTHIPKAHKSKAVYLTLSLSQITKNAVDEDMFCGSGLRG